MHLHSYLFDCYQTKRYGHHNSWCICRGTITSTWNKFCFRRNKKNDTFSNTKVEITQNHRCGMCVRWMLFVIVDFIIHQKNMNIIHTYLHVNMKSPKRTTKNPSNHKTKQKVFFSISIDRSLILLFCHFSML